MFKGLSHSGSLSEAERADINKYKYAAWMCYLWLGSLYIYVAFSHKSPYLRHHARQGIIIGFVMTYFMFVPVVGLFFLVPGVILQLIGMVQGHMGDYFHIPLVGKAIARNKTIAGIEEMIFNGGRLMSEIKKASREVKQADSEMAGKGIAEVPKKKEELLEEVYEDRPQWE